MLPVYQNNCKMKNILLPIFILICAPGGLLAQLHVASSTLIIQSGAVLYNTGDVTTAGSATLDNEGTLNTQGDINNGGTSIMQGNGQYTLKGDWTNLATFDAGTSTVTFEGATNSIVTSGGDAFYDLELAKTTADLLLADDMVVFHNLEFISDDNQVFIADNDLTFGESATVTGYDNNDYIVTGGTGQVKKTNLGTTAFVFPVGFDASTYNPLTLVQSDSGVVDDFGVRVLENVLADGSSGLVLIKGVADASWEVTESVIGGSDLTITAEWKGTDELTGFDRDDSGISHYGGTGWDLTNADAGMASGTDPYTRTRSGVAEVGYFAVGGVDLMTYVAVTPKVFLQGPYFGSLMNDDLRIQALIPTVEPYDALPNFTHVGRGGGETVDPAVFELAGNNAIVDWVFLELRDKNTPSTVIETRSALVQSDGDIVDVDGTSEVRFVGIAGDNYYLVVRHRNHLGVCTDTALALSILPFNIDFTDINTVTYGTNAQKNLGGDIMGMWGGNVIQDGALKYSGSNNDRAPILIAIGGTVLTATISGYLSEDTNLDGIVKYSGSNNDRAIILVNLGGLVLTATLLEQLP